MIKVQKILPLYKFIEENTFTDILGVMNITPNSFSDGGKYNNTSSLKLHFKDLYKKGVRYFDFGAESSAPFNNPISADEELKRFEEIFFPFIEELDARDIVLSIDTYKPSVFKVVYEYLFQRGFDQIIWNDISGVVDKETIETLKACSKSSYVLSHNLTPSRDKALEHLEFIENDLSAKEVNLFLKHNISLLKDEEVTNEILIDPCFGFSKTKDQNYLLLKDIEQLLLGLEDHTLVLGVSKKSFLQALSSKELKENRREESEYAHSIIIFNWLKELKSFNKLLRIHNPSVYEVSLGLYNSLK